MILASRSAQRRFRRSVRGASCLGLLVAVLLGSSSIRAQEVDAETRTVARDLALQGAEAFERKDYATALDRFERASQLYRAPSISIMQARSLQRLGRLIAALDRFEETQRMPLAADAPEAFRQAVADAKREGQQLSPRIPRLTVRVRITDRTLSNVTIWLDGKRVPPALYDVERPIDPGTHTLLALAPGRLSVRRSVALAEGDRTTLELPIGDTVSGDHAGRAATESTSDSAHDEGDAGRSAQQRRQWGWIGVGVGAAGLAGSVVTGVLALDKKSSLDAVCRPGCPPSSAEDIDSYRRYRTLSYVSLAVGVTAAGVGGYLLLTGSRDNRHVAAAIGTGGVHLSGAF